MASGSDFLGTVRAAAAAVPDPSVEDGSASSTLAERVFATLCEAILQGELAPGTKISEPLLARKYGVSRGPLREALHRLQERRLITRSANQGARVVRLSAEGLAEIFVVREATNAPEVVRRLSPLVRLWANGAVRKTLIIVVLGIVWEVSGS